MNQLIVITAASLPALVIAATIRSTRTARFYGRRRDEMSVDEVKRIEI